MTTTGTDLIESLIRSASGDQRRIVGAVEHWGVAAVSTVLADEVVFRSEPAINHGKVTVNLVLIHGHERHTITLLVGEGQGPVRTEERPGRVDMELEFAVVDLVRELFGPGTNRSSGTHATRFLPGDDSTVPNVERVQRIAMATDAVLAGCSAYSPRLGTLALRHGSDKWGCLRWSTPHYERHLSALRGHQVRVLELGVGGYESPNEGGGSLRMWKHFFPRGLICGIDVFDKSLLDEPRITTIQGRQDDVEFLERVCRDFGPFDLIVDDGSHIANDILTAFAHLYPALRPGGWYVIEDLWSSHWAGYGGDSNPRNSTGTALEMLKSLVDRIQCGKGPGGGADDLGNTLVGLNLYHSIVFLEKGTNREGAIPQWIPRRPFWSTEAPSANLGE